MRRSDITIAAQIGCSSFPVQKQRDLFGSYMVICLFRTHTFRTVFSLPILLSITKRNRLSINSIIFFLYFNDSFNFFCFNMLKLIFSINFLIKLFIYGIWVYLFFHLHLLAKHHQKLLYGWCIPLKWMQNLWWCSKWFCTIEHLTAGILNYEQNLLWFQNMLLPKIDL